MTAAAPSYARPSRSRPAAPPREDAARLRELLGEARALDRAQSEALTVMAFLLHWALATVRPVVVVDLVIGERRLLGALLAGHATLADVDELRASYFEGNGHGLLFACISALLEVAREQGFDLPPPGWARRKRMEGLLRKLLADPEHEPAEARAALRALAGLPWPASCPRSVVRLLAALGEWRKGDER